MESGEQLGVRRQTAQSTLRRFRKAVVRREGMDLLEGLGAAGDGCVAGVCAGRRGCGTTTAKVAVAMARERSPHPQRSGLKS